jgi:hypothetical protein
MNNEHNQPGHVNAYVLDHNSKITGFGNHARVIAGMDTQTGELYCRVDMVHGLRAPNVHEILDVARREDFKGRWVMKSRDVESPAHHGGESIHYAFTR